MECNEIIGGFYIIINRIWYGGLLIDFIDNKRCIAQIAPLISPLLLLEMVSGKLTYTHTHAVPTHVGELK